jgi:hypothetical protein
MEIKFPTCGKECRLDTKEGEKRKSKKGHDGHFFPSLTKTPT